MFTCFVLPCIHCSGGAYGVLLHYCRFYSDNCHRHHHDRNLYNRFPFLHSHLYCYDGSDIPSCLHRSHCSSRLKPPVCFRPLQPRMQPPILRLLPPEFLLQFSSSQSLLCLSSLIRFKGVFPFIFFKFFSNLLKSVPDNFCLSSHIVSRPHSSALSSTARRCPDPFWLPFFSTSCTGSGLSMSFSLHPTFLFRNKEGWMRVLPSNLPFLLPQVLFHRTEMPRPQTP